MAVTNIPLSWRRWNTIVWNSIRGTRKGRKFKNGKKEMRKKKETSKARICWVMNCVDVMISCFFYVILLTHSISFYDKKDLQPEREKWTILKSTGEMLLQWANYSEMVSQLWLCTVIIRTDNHQAPTVR